MFCVVVAPAQSRARVRVEPQHQVINHLSTDDSSKRALSLDETSTSLCVLVTWGSATPSAHIKFNRSWCVCVCLCIHDSEKDCECMPLGEKWVARYLWLINFWLLIVQRSSSSSFSAALFIVALKLACWLRFLHFLFILYFYLNHRDTLNAV